MTNSVNTNFGAIVALQSLSRTNMDLQSTQKRVSTGYRVADAVDDGAAFAVAQGLRSDVKAYEAVSERLSTAKGLLTVTQEALKGVSDTLGEVRKVLVKLGDDSLSADERAQYNADYASLRTEIDNFIAQASFNGANLLNTAGGDVSIIFDIDGGTFDLVSQDIEAETADLVDVADASAATTLLGGDFVTFQSTVGSALSTIGGYIRSVSNQESFTKVLADATTVGIGSIVDADLAKESARLQSLQIRQQLGTQALSIANQGPSILLNLFR